VHPAAGEDVPDIARIQLDTWRQAYSGWLPAPVLDQITPADAERTWRQAVSAPPTPRHHVLVAREQAWRVGFAAFGPAPEDGSGPVGVVDALLVEPRWGRRGHGSRLLAATVEVMRRDGLRTAQVWVPEPDAASLASIGEVTETSPASVTLRVPRDRVAAAAAELLRRLPVADLTIEEVDVGTIVERIFSERAGSPR